MKNYKLINIVVTIVILSSLIVCYKNYKYQKKVESLTKDIEFYTDSLNTYTKLYPSTEFSKLKKENKELYNKLKEKESLVEAIEFEWKYKYEGLEQQVDKLQKNDSLYRFNIQSDTVGYDLKVWANHLAKYKLDFNISNKLLLSHQQVGNDNRFEITSNLPGKIQDVTIWTKPKKKSRFGAGISIGAGYGMFNKDFDVFVGLSGTYLIW